MLPSLGREAGAVLGSPHAGRNPPEFEAFAREQVEAGTYASTEEAVAVALRDYLARLEELRALIDEGPGERRSGGR